MKSWPKPSEPARKPPTGLAFLLAQVGAHGAMQFARRMEAIGLTPPDAGILRKLAMDPGITQQALAEHLGVVPSRMVALLDGLEQRGLVERASSPDDRRSYALRLTPRGQEMLGQIMRIGGEHEQDMCAALNAEERATLAKLLRRVAEQQGLTPGVHPGFRTLGGRRGGEACGEGPKGK
jgi:DNA-binding MarR family transcriptional regulator